jgi:site-specific DNA-methyltransferase (adenine-specific)
VYGSGFPKSLDVSKAIDKVNGEGQRVQSFVRYMKTTQLKAKDIDEALKQAGLISLTSNRAIHYFNEGQPQIPTWEMWQVIRPMLGEVPFEIDLLVDRIEAEREVIATQIRYNEPSGIVNVGQGDRQLIERKISISATPQAQQWQGWGTALKPALEPIVVARKPLIGTVAENVLTHGTGGLNIDASRIGTNGEKIQPFGTPTNSKGGILNGTSEQRNPETIANAMQKVEALGRWPANLILSHGESCQPTGKTIKSKTGAGKRTATFGTQDTQSGGDGSGGWSGYEYETEVYECVEGCPVKTLDEQSETSKSPTGMITQGGKAGGGYDIGSSDGTRNTKFQGHGDSGGASRFFYVAKASKRDRNEGLEDMPLRKSDQRSDKAAGIWAEMEAPKQNFHPTVKPTELMRYLVKLITPPGGTVLDPFTGSGSTGKAAILEGFDFIGIELTEDYWPIIEGRLKHAEAKVAERIKETSDQEQEKLF